jgi:tetratricopeptide (TPR) repeat protein
MKRTLSVLLIIISGLILVGYTSNGNRSYSDLAEYKRLPMNTRIHRLQKKGEELYLRRKYEEALAVFETILSLDESDMEAKLWITKTKARVKRERNEEEKKNLYKKYGRLIPKEMSYHNWHWGPSVGHFEVKYSEPKPYNPPERKFHPKATDEEIAEQKAKAESSQAAEDYFELSMRYWSRRMKEKALNAYFTAVKIDPAILAEDDELMLETLYKEIIEVLENKNPTGKNYYDAGRIGMIQGDRRQAVQNLISASRLDKELKNEVSKIIASYVVSPEVKQSIVPPDIYSYRQAYVFDEDADMIYIRIVGIPRGNRLVFPLDITFDLKAIKKLEIASNDLAFAYAMPGQDKAARIWFVLPEKEEFAEYDLRLIAYVDRDYNTWIDLSNYAIPPEQPDNWSFVIGSEFNFGEMIPQGEFEKHLDGVQVTGYHLSRSEGKGPYIDLSYFKEPMPKEVDVWEFIENAGEIQF